MCWHWTQESSASPGRSGTPDFGKFYKSTTYMELKDGYKRAPSINADTGDKPAPQHFHRPGQCRSLYIGRNVRKLRNGQNAKTG